MDTVARSAARRCDRCSAPIESTNPATICLACAVTIYTELLPGAGALLRPATDHEWLVTVGFAPGADWWARTAPWNGLAAEVFGLSWSATGLHYHEENLVSRTGLVALIRVRCPSMMLYESAIPVGPRPGAEGPRPERLLGPLAPTIDALSRELTAARTAANELALSRGGPTPNPWDEDFELLVGAILATQTAEELRSISAPDSKRIKREVALYLYGGGEGLDPGNSLRHVIRRVHNRSQGRFASRDAVWKSALDEAARERT